jgi:hypothetical protein
MAETRSPADAPEADEALWPVVARPSEPTPSGADDLDEPGRGGRFGSLARVVGLLGLLGVVTAAGIALGRGVEPSHPQATTTAAASTTTVPVAPPRPVVRKVTTVSWGPLKVQRYGSFPAGPPNAAAAVVGSKLAVVGGAGTGLVLAGPFGGKLLPVAMLSRPRASAEAFAFDGNLYVLGGEQGGKPSDDLLRIDLTTRHGRRVSKFVEPLAEAGVVTRGKAVYLVGGWTGEKYATAILKFTPPGTEALVARLPGGLRSPAVALLGHTLYVAGGSTETGLSDRIYAVDLDSGALTSLGRLPRPVTGGLLVPSGKDLYLLGGTGKGGKPSAAVVRIDPATGRPAAAGRMPKPLAGAAAVSAPTGTVVVDPASGAIYRIK